MKIHPNTTCAVILAAGKGTRMNAGGVNKVTLPIGGKPIILRAVERLKDAGIAQIFVVVGHAKESVIEVLGKEVTYIEQEEQLGTGHAVQVALAHLPKNFEDIFVFYGDDTSYEPSALQDLYSLHKTRNNCLTFLTCDVDDPTDFGRIVRDEKGMLKGIVEEKDASETEKKIHEINPGCFLFKRWFLEKYISDIPLNPIKKEYYITDMIALGLKSGEKVEALKGDSMTWQGINTKEELEKAEKYIQQNE